MLGFLEYRRTKPNHNLTMEKRRENCLPINSWYASDMGVRFHLLLLTSVFYLCFLFAAWGCDDDPSDELTVVPKTVHKGASATLSVRGPALRPAVQRNMNCGGDSFNFDDKFLFQIRGNGADDQWIELSDVTWQFDSRTVSGVLSAEVSATLEGWVSIRIVTPEKRVLLSAVEVVADSTDSDTGPDTATDSMTDTTSGSSGDTGSATESDTPMNTDPDTGRDSATGSDSTSDSGTGMDTNTDDTESTADTGTGTDTVSDFSTETGTGTDLDTGTGEDTGSAVVDTGLDTGTETTDTDTGTGTDTDTGTDTGTDTDSAGRPYCEEIPALSEQPVIDGVPDVDFDLEFVEPVGWNNNVDALPDGHEMAYVVAWYNTGIYFYIEVIDPDRNPPEAGDNLYLGDGVEVYVDHDGNYLTPPPDYDYIGTRQIILPAPEDDVTPTAFGTIRTATGWLFDPFTGDQWAVIPTPGGYVVEIFVVPENLNLTAMNYEAGDHIGFDLAHNVSLPPGETGVDGNRLGQYFLKVREPFLGDMNDFPWSNESVFCTAILLPE